MKTPTTSAARKQPRPHFNKEKHLRLLKKLEHGQKPEPWVDEWIRQNREHPNT